MLRSQRVSFDGDFNTLIIEVRIRMYQKIKFEQGDKWQSVEVNRLVVGAQEMD